MTSGLACLSASSPCGPDLHRDSARRSHSTHGHRAQVDHSRIRAGSRGRHQARLRRLAAGVVGPAAARVFRFRSPGTGSKRAGRRRSCAVPGSCGRSAIRGAALATEKSANENRHRDDVWRPLRDRWFESCSLQGRVQCELPRTNFRQVSIDAGQCAELYIGHVRSGPFLCPARAPLGGHLLAT
jgi:hypothetical protein